MCRAIEINLTNHGMGLPEMISEVDALVFADDEILVGRYTDKDRRAVRVERNKNQKERNKRLYDPSDVIHWSKKAEFNEFRGITPVFHGEDEPVAFIKKSRKNGTKQTLNKVENRKVRHERFEESIPEAPIVGKITLCEDEEDWTQWCNTLPLGEKIGVSNKKFFKEYDKTHLERLFELRHKVTMARLKVLDAKLDLALAEVELKNFEMNDR